MTHSNSVAFSEVHNAIESRRFDFATHPFLKRLDASSDIDDVRVMAQSLTFYVLAFQDMLRISAHELRATQFAALAQTHYLEDKGHQLWFLDDLKKLGVSVEVSQIFGARYDPVRDISYRLVSEVLRPSADAASVAVVLSLEAVGAEFFGRVIRLLTRAGFSERLSYFAPSHAEVESAHEVFEEGSQANLASLPLSAEDLSASLKAVDVTFEQMSLLGSVVLAKMDEAKCDEVV